MPSGDDTTIAVNPLRAASSVSSREVSRKSNASAIDVDIDALSSEDEDEDSHPHTRREQLYHTLESPKVVLSMLGLVILDCVLVLVQLMIDLDAFVVSHDILEVMHIVSILILGTFVVEVTLKMFAMGLRYFKSPWELFDGSIVISSFTLDVIYSANDAKTAASLLIILRLWRLARVVHGFVHAARAKANKRVAKYKRRLAELQKKYNKLERKLRATREELHQLLDRPP